MGFNVPGMFLPDAMRRGVRHERGKGIDSTAGRWAFSGADLHVYVGTEKIGNLVSLTVSVTREVLPLYTFGDPSPRTFVRGKRGIAGTMTFTQFDSHALLSTFRFQKESRYEYDIIEDIWSGLWDASVPGQEEYSYSSGWIQRVKQLKQLYEQGRNNNAMYITNRIAETYEYVARREIRYVDQLPPFDMTLIFINEAGAFAYLSLLGVQFVNEGFGYTLDDLASEIGVTYVATGIRPLSNRPPAAFDSALPYETTR